MSSQRISVIGSIEELASVRTFWEAHPEHPYSDFEFFSVIVGSRRETVSPCVLVLYEGERPVALLAARRETARQLVRFGYATIGSVKLRQVVVVAGGFIGKKTVENWSKLVLALGSWTRRNQVDRIVFEQLDVAGCEFTYLRSRFGAVQFALARTPASHWTMALPSSWDEFLGSRSKKHRYWLKRLSRVLERDFGAGCQIKRYDSERHIDDFMQAADAVAERTYQRSINGGFRLNAEYIERVTLDARRNRLRGYVLFIADVPVAYWYCSIYGASLHLIATGFDPIYRDYELGTVLLMNVFREHCGSDVTVVDFGPGDAGYKRRFASDSFSEAYVNVFAHSPRGILLGSVHAVNRLLEESAKWMLDKVGMTQTVKSFWRRGLAHEGATSDRE